MDFGSGTSPRCGYVHTFFGSFSLGPFVNIICGDWNLQNKALFFSALKRVIQNGKLIAGQNHGRIRCTTLECFNLQQRRCDILSLIYFLTQEYGFFSFRDIGKFFSVIRRIFKVNTLSCSDYRGLRYWNIYCLVDCGVIPSNGVPAVYASRSAASGKTPDPSASGGKGLGWFSASEPVGPNSGGTSGLPTVRWGSEGTCCHSLRDAGLRLSGAHLKILSMWDIQIALGRSIQMIFAGPCQRPAPKRLIFGLRIQYITWWPTSNGPLAGHDLRRLYEWRYRCQLSRKPF